MRPDLIFVLSVLTFGGLYVFLVNKFDESVKGTYLDMDRTSFKNGINHFRLSLPGKIQLYGFLLAIGIATPSMFLILVTSTIASILMLLGAGPFDSEIVYAFVFSVIFFGIIFRYLLVASVNGLHHIRVVDGGLLIRVYYLRFYWVFVAWQDIEDIVFSTKILPQGNMYWIIKLNNVNDKKLVQASRMIGGDSTGILLHYYMQRREKLIGIIEKHMTAKPTN